MSVVKCFTTVLSIAIYISKCLGYEIVVAFVLTVHKVHIYALYYSVMWCITLDRLLLVFLDIKYQIYCTERRAKIVVVTIWILCIVASGVVCILQVYSIQYIDSLLELFAVLSITFLMFVVITYSVIFYKFIQTRHSPHGESESRSCTMGVMKLLRLFRNSRFFLSALLIIAYVILFVVPSFLFHVHKSARRLRIMWFSTALSYMVDAVIYILSKPCIRKLCLKILRRKSELTQPIIV